MLQIIYGEYHNSRLDKIILLLVGIDTPDILRGHNHTVSSAGNGKLCLIIFTMVTGSFHFRAEIGIMHQPKQLCF